tara:strand:- start:358 stop:3300 length:2943 start_codon:yes stop_codon:yes gene_type:complete
MAEKVIIDIELKGFGNAQKNLDDFTKKQIEQQDAIKATKDAIKEYEKELQAIAQEQALGNEITDESILRERELQESLEESKVSLAGQKDELSAVNTERRAAVKEVDTYNTALNAEIGSNEQLRAQLKLMTQEYDGLSQEQRENTEEGQMLTQNIEGITEKLKENESAIGDNRRNVGNYSESIQDALGNVTIMGTNLGGLVTSFKETKDATAAAAKSLIITESVQKSQAAATNSQTIAQKALNVATIAGKVAMNVFKLALISTGIGAFVVAIGSLVAFFKSTEKGAQQLKVVMAALGSITANITSKFAEFGEIIFNSFNNIKELKLTDVFTSIGDAIKNNILNRIEAFGLAGKAIAKIFSGDVVDGFKELGNATAQAFTGIEDPIGKLEQAGQKIVEVYEDGKAAVGEFAKEVEADIGKAIELQQRENNLVDERRRLLLENTELELKVASARVAAADKANLSQDEIIAKLEEAKEAESQKLQNLTKIAKAEFEIQKGRSALATDNEEEAEELFQKELAFQQALTAEKQGVLRLEKQIASESYILMTESLAAELKLIKAQGGDQVAALIEIEEKKRAAQLADTTLSETQRQAIIAESNNKLADLQLSAIEEKIKNEKDAATLTALQNEEAYLRQFQALDGNLEAQQKLTKEYNAQKLLDAKKLVEDEIQILQQQLVDATASTEGGIGDAILSDEQLKQLKKNLAELGVDLATLDGQINNVGKDEEGNTFGDSLGLDDEKTEKIISSFSFAIGAIDQILAIASQNLQTQTDERIAAIDKQVESGVISEEAAEKQKTKVRKQAFKQQKKMDIASATMSYFEGLIQAFAQALRLGPIAGPIVGAINAGILTGTYSANIQQIKAQKFAEGGVIQGASHAQGGVPFSVAGRGGFEAEGGEFIHKTKAVEHYGLPFMNALNNLQLPKMFAEGGYVAPVTASSISQQVSDGVSELVSVNENRGVQVVNVEQDFSNLQNKVNNVESARTY